MADSQPPHRICPECYERGKKGHLQATGERRGRYGVHRCASCKTEAVFGEEVRPREPDQSAEIELD